MKPDAIVVTLLLGGIGLFSLAWGISVKTGKIKGWWAMRDSPITPVAYAYASIPAGISFVVLGFSLLFPTPNLIGQLLFDLSTIMLVISFILAIWRPRWLVPKWLLWLEDNHGDIYGQLRIEAQNVNIREWEKRVRTQEGLEAWALEVRRKYGV